MENITDHDRKAIIQAINDRLNQHNWMRPEQFGIQAGAELGGILKEAGVSRRNYDVLMTKPHLWPMTRDEWWIGLAKALNYTFLSINTLPK